MADSHDISILIATHNRAESVQKSLHVMRLLATDGMSYEIVVIDNNSTDQTREVVTSFEADLPVRYLFEQRPGKNCALNTALAEIQLGQLVVFMDDDISPDTNCLQAIQATSARWPDASVFGGRIEIAFPDLEVPRWALNPRIHPFAFGLHHQPGGEGPYPAGVFPFGGLFWVRKLVFDDGRRFNESVGPRPSDRIMGSETTFLRKLRDDGYEMIYGPDAFVTHRVQEHLFSKKEIRTRAYRQGRGTAHWRGPAFHRLFRVNRPVWFLACVVGMAWFCLMTAVSLLSLSSAARVERCIKNMKKMGHIVESLRLASTRDRNWTTSC